MKKIKQFWKNYKKYKKIKKGFYAVRKNWKKICETFLLIKRH